MSEIHEIVAAHLPARRRATSLGWVNCNAPCCHHRGHRPDTRSRGNFLFATDGAIAYNCYNCGFKTVFDNASLSRNFESLMGWMGISSESINRIKMMLLQNRMDGTTSAASMPDMRFTGEFKEVDLPQYSLPFESVIEEDEIPAEFVEAMEYLDGRGEAILNGWDYYWNPSTKHDMNKRVIIPFYHRSKIVGWTARYVGTPPKGTPRYYNGELQPGYLFNCNVLNDPARSYVLVAEGPFDAIALSGIATLGSQMSREQIAWLNSTNKEKIIVPDRQRNNQGLIDDALAQGWSVSFPDWEPDVKDAAEASKRYGKLFTIRSAIAARTTSHLQIGVKRRMFK